ncbi:MAG: response regulator [Myxococcales bacterium]|nr:response regulator [Myxococcales bacterium]
MLFVDDEPAVLEAIAVNLRRSFDVLTAPSGPAGLKLLEADHSICVVVSDMRMPTMTGAVFLSRAREVAPSAVRMLLTGQADMASAIDAVNNGQIFRFLTKPCPRELLKSSIDGAVEQHRLQTVERELLEQTVRGSVKMLFDVLALASPAAFGRGNRIKTRVLDLAKALGVTETWHLEVASLASQLGYISLPDTLLAKLSRGDVLTEEERQLVARTPDTAVRLLANIPRLDAVREVLATHARPPHRVGTTWRSSSELGAHLLRFAIDLDDLEGPGGQPLETRIVRQRIPHADAEVFGAYERLRDVTAVVNVKELPLAQLRVGMTLAEDVRLATGALLVARGYEITAQFLDRVENFPKGTVAATVRVVA